MESPQDTKLHILPSFKIMSRNSIPRFRAQVIDLFIHALGAHREIQMYQDDEVEVEEGRSQKLEQVKTRYNALLLELACIKEIRRSEISKFYPAADYELLRTFSEDLISWTSRLRSWMMKAQTDGVLPKCKKVEKKRVAGRIERAHANGPVQAVVAGAASESQGLLILKHLIKTQKSIELVRLSPTKRSLEAVRSGKARGLKKSGDSNVSFRPNNTVVQQFSQTLARAVDEYKACRWYFHQVEAEYSHVLEQASRPLAVRPTWKDTVDKVLKQLLGEYANEITDLVRASNLSQSAAALHKEVADKFLELQQYPLHAILQFSKELQLKISSGLQSIQDPGDIEEQKIMVDGPGLLLAIPNQF